MLINHIDEVLPFIDGRKDFIRVQKDGYQVIDYVYQENDSFNEPIRRECRGLKFADNGDIIGRPLHKFFNYAEKAIKYDWNRPHRILTKMDGSMVHSCLIDGELRLCTRMGITEQSLMAEQYLTKTQSYYLKTLNQQGFNAIFEFVSPDNRIVIEYDEPKLILLAIRNIRDGRYYQLGHIEEQFEVVDQHQFVINDSTIETLRANITGIEGFVVTWNDGTYVKIKGDEYVQMHRAVSFFERESMILPIVLDSQCDDLYPALTLDRAERLFKYESEVMKEFLTMVEDCNAQVSRSQFWSRKQYALWVNENIPQSLRGAYFAALDGKEAAAAVKSALIKDPGLLTTRW